MNKLYVFLLLNLYVGYSHSMESSDSNFDSEYYDALEYSSDSETEEKTSPLVCRRYIKKGAMKMGFKDDLDEWESAKNIDIDKFKFVPNEQEKVFFYKMLKNAQIKIQVQIRREKQEKQSVCRPNCWLLAHGKPGIGRSALIKAMACELGACYFINSEDFLFEYGDETFRYLSELIKAVSKKPGKSIVVIDGLHTLTESDISNWNPELVESMLCDRLDQNKSNLNFLLFITIPESKKIRQRLYSRCACIGLEITMDINDHKELIKGFLDNLKVPVDSEVNSYFEMIVAVTKNYTLNHLEIFFEKAQRFAIESDNSVLTIKSIKKAFKVIKALNSRYDKYSFMTDEERRHQEKMEQNRKIHEEKMAHMRRMIVEKQELLL